MSAALLCLAGLLLVRHRQRRAAARKRLTPAQQFLLWSDGFS